MRRETLGGWAMIAGAVMGLVAMGFHPTTAERATLVTAVHALAIAGAPVAFYGGWALARRLSAGGALAELALVFYGVAAVATLLAATASGLLAPGLAAGFASHDAGAREMAEALAHYNHALNQAFAKVLVAASSVAIGLWSLEIVRTRLMRRAAGILGCVIAPLTLLALFSGHLTLDVHVFGAVVLLQAVWLIMVGSELRRTGDAPA
ncbi:MAG TPA: hypothetical protein VFR37_06590 [Longimicrobium sp.]|nr:hypothetical protein [Longimicrobium sp.]